MLAVDDGEEDGVVRRARAGLVGTGAEHEAEGVGGLVPCAASLDFVGLVGWDVGDAGKLQWVGQVCGGQAVSDDFGEGASSERVVGVGDIVVNESFSGLGIEEHPVLLDRRAC